MSALTEKRRAADAQQRRTRLLVWALFPPIILAMPLVMGNFGLTVLTQMCIAATFALSYNMLLGQGGMLSFGHAVYFGLGGFLSIHLMNLIGDGLLLPVALIPLFGGLFGMMVGLVVASFSTRRAGTVFAMISVGIAELVAGSSLILIDFFGGEGGISSDRTDGPAIFGFRLVHQIEVYYVATFWFLVASFLIWRFSRTPAGRMANAVRDNPERAEFIGFSQRRVRFTSFVASSFFAGLAGGMFAIQYEIVTAVTVSMAASAQVLLQTYIGGIGYFAGPIVGAVTLTLFNALLSGATDLWLLYMGVLFVVTVLFVPQGLTGLFMMHVPVIRFGRPRLLVWPYLLSGACLAIVLGGVIGLVEMVNFLHRAAVGETVMRLFRLDVDTQSWAAWVGFSAMIAVGLTAFLASRRLVAEAWQAARSPRNVSDKPRGEVIQEPAE